MYSTISISLRWKLFKTRYSIWRISINTFQKLSKRSFKIKTFFAFSLNRKLVDNVNCKCNWNGILPGWFNRVKALYQLIARHLKKSITLVWHLKKNANNPLLASTTTRLKLPFPPSHCSRRSHSNASTLLLKVILRNKRVKTKQKRFQAGLE